MPNAVLEDYRVIINSQDVSAAVSGERWLDLNYPRHSESGLYEATGEIVLLPIQGFAADFFSPRKNRNQWIRGNAVTVDLKFGDGVWERTFTGFIERRPATPTSQSPELVIPIICELGYRNREAKAGDNAGVVLGTSTPRTTIIGNLWATLGGAGPWSGSIPKHPIAYNVPKHTGSYVEQMGEIALGGLTGLYCDRNGALQAASLSSGPGPYLVNRTDDNAFLVPADGSETPAYEVNVTAVGRSVEDTQLSRTIGPLIQTGPVKINVFTGAVEIGTYKTTTITEAWAPDRKSRSISTLVTGLDFDVDQNYTLAPRSNTVITETYSQAIDGKLLTRTTTVSRDRRFIDARLTNSTITYNGSTLSSTDLVQDSQTVESWTYDGEVPIVYVKETYSIALKLDGVVRRLEPYLKERLTETYTDLGGGEWLKVVEDEERIFLDSDVLYPRGESGTFQGPDYAPREPSRHAPIAKTEPQTYTGSSTYDIAGSNEEPAEYEINYGVSDAQAQELSEWYGALLVGRDQSWTASHELTKAWVQGWNPGAKVRLTLPDDDIIAALVDGVNISINQAAAIVSYGATELGVIGSSGANIIPPYTQGVNGRTSVVEVQGVSNPLAGVPTGGSVDGRVSVVEVQGVSGSYSEGVNSRTSVVRVMGVRTGNAGAVEQLATLSVFRGGTGGSTAAQARANLGIDLAGGDLTGSYPNPGLAAQWKPLAAKGDLYGHDGATPVRIPVGSTGQTLYADPTESSGLRWGAASGGVVSAKGDLFTHDGTDSARLPVGTDGQMLYASPASPTGLAWGAAPSGGGGGGGSLVLNAFRATQITQSAIGAFPFDDESTGTTDWASNVWTAPQNYSALLVLAQLRVINQNRVVFAIRLNKASVAGEVWEDVVTCDRPQGFGGTAGTGGGTKVLSVLAGDQLRMTTFTTETYRGDVNGSQSYFQLYAL